MASKKLYITADSADNSIVLSEGLCRELNILTGNVVRIFVFRIKESGNYGLQRVNATFAERTECPIVSYNPKYDQYGFMSSLPTVNRMFYDMRIEDDQATLKVKKRILPDESIIYEILPPCR